MTNYSDQMVSDTDMVSTILDKLCWSTTPIAISQEENLYWGIIKDVNLFSQKLAIRPQDPQSPFALDPNLPISVTSDSNNLFFKTKLTNFCKSNLIFTKLPRDILIQNARTSARFHFEKEEFPIFCNNFTLVDYSLNNLNWKATLIDISESGIAFKSSDPLVQKFNVGDTIIFTFINTLALTKKLSGKIVHIQEQNTNKNTFSKIGVQFEYIIPIYDVLEYLKEKND